MGEEDNEPYVEASTAVAAEDTAAANEEAEPTATATTTTDPAAKTETEEKDQPAASTTPDGGDEHKKKDGDNDDDKKETETAPDDDVSPSPSDEGGNKKDGGNAIFRKKGAKDDSDGDDSKKNTTGPKSYDGSSLPKFGDKLPIFDCMNGMMQDLRARLPLYVDDWKRPKNIPKVINAIFFAFVVQLIPALIFAELLDKQTNGSLAVAEVLLSAGIIGIIYALICGQPLVLLGITGPVAILLGTSYGLAEKFNASYFPFFWWLCIWTSLLHLITAMVGLVNFVWQITPFSSQIFEFFIAMSFIYESIRDLVEPIHFSEAEDVTGERSVGYANLVIGICTFYICWTLHFAETWVYYTREVRTFLTR